MTSKEAKKFLDGCVREELRDHAFGDAEVYWMRDGEEFAFGYFGSESDVVGGSIPHPWEFKGREARELRKCGTLGAVERNDSTGDDVYREGECRYGLTLAGVLSELTGGRDD